MKLFRWKVTDYFFGLSLYQAIAVAETEHDAMQELFKNCAPGDIQDLRAAFKKGCEEVLELPCTLFLTID